MYNITRITIEEELIKSLLAPTKIERFALSHGIFKTKFIDREGFRLNKNIKLLIEDLEKIVKENEYQNIDITLLCIYYGLELVVQNFNDKKVSQYQNLYKKSHATGLECMFTNYLGGFPSSLSYFEHDIFDLFNLALDYSKGIKIKRKT